MFSKRILNVYSIVAGLFLIISGTGKMMDTAAFSNLIDQYGLGYFKLLSPFIVIAELLLGFLLVLLIHPKRYSFFSFVLLLLFTIAFSYGHFRHGVNDCGCFGTLQPSHLPPILIFTRNFILLTMLLLVWLKYPKGSAATAQWKTVFIVFVMCPSIFISGFTFQAPLKLSSNSERHKYQNRHIKDTELSKYIKTSPDSTYLVLCFSYACSHCWNSIENFRQFRKSHTVDSVIALATGEIADRNFFIQSFNPDFCIQDLAPEAMSKMADGFPTTFYVMNDSIKVVMQSEIPSPVTFTKYQFAKF